MSLGFGEEAKKIGDSARDLWIRLTPTIEALTDLSDVPIYEDGEGKFIRLLDYLDALAAVPPTGEF